MPEPPGPEVPRVSGNPAVVEGRPRSLKSRKSLLFVSDYQSASLFASAAFTRGVSLFTVLTLAALLTVSESQPEQRDRVGLRERKKAETRAAIQHEALRLFRVQGYDETTTEQIAEAAEDPPSTLFRYFPSKEDLALTDDYTRSSSKRSTPHQRSSARSRRSIEGCGQCSRQPTTGT